MNTFEEVKKLFVEQLSIAEDKITMDADVIVDLKADSLDLFLLITSFEDKFGIKISDDDAAGLKTIGQIVEYIDSHKN